MPRAVIIRPYLGVNSLAPHDSCALYFLKGFSTAVNSAEQPEENSSPQNGPWKKTRPTRTTGKQRPRALELVRTRPSVSPVGAVRRPAAGAVLTAQGTDSRNTFTAAELISCGSMSGVEFRTRMHSRGPSDIRVRGEISRHDGPLKVRPWKMNERSRAEDRADGMDSARPMTHRSSCEPMRRAPHFFTSRAHGPNRPNFKLIHGFCIFCFFTQLLHGVLGPLGL